MTREVALTLQGFQNNMTSLSVTYGTFNYSYFGGARASSSLTLSFTVVDASGFQFLFALLLSVVQFIQASCSTFVLQVLRGFSFQHLLSVVPIQLVFEASSERLQRCCLLEQVSLASPASESEDGAGVAGVATAFP